MNGPSPAPKKQTQSGFSLIEVTIAIAIVAVAVVSLLGMIPQGLRTMTSASDQAIYGRIHQQILGELQLASWEVKSGTSEITQKFNGQVRKYDDQGILVDSGDDREHVYFARIHVPEIGGGERPASLGGGMIPPVVLSGSNETNRFVRTVIIEVAASSQPVFDFDDDANFPIISHFHTTLTKLGQEFNE